MNLYQKHIEPRLINLACGAKPIQKQREKVVPRARGRVLEVGFGSGHNLPFYDAANVEHIFALEPSAGMRKRSKKRAEASPIEIEYLDLPGEEIPLDDETVDSVLITFTMCTIPDVTQALSQMRRVLKPGGAMYFCEHGRAPDAGVARWQNRLNPIWKALGGGCNLNRDISGLITGSGFKIDDMETGYIPGQPKFAGYEYWGAARPD